LGHIVLVENPSHNLDGDFFYPKLNRKLPFAGISFIKKRCFLFGVWGGEDLPRSFFDG